MYSAENGSAFPPSQGLYNPANEHDACGIGFVVNIKGKASHDIVLKGLQILVIWRIAARADAMRKPAMAQACSFRFRISSSRKKSLLVVLRCRLRANTVSLCAFCRWNGSSGWSAKDWWNELRAKRAGGFGLARHAGRRRCDWPGGTRVAALYSTAFRCTPSRHGCDEFERRLYVVRKRAESQVAKSEVRDKSFFYIPSFSSRTIVYKGLLLAHQIGQFYAELLDPDTVSAMCLVHRALLHEYLSHVATGASLPLYLP